MGWVSVNNPTKKTVENLKPFTDAAYEKAVLNFRRRIK